MGKDRLGFFHRHVFGNALYLSRAGFIQNVSTFCIEIIE